MRQLRGTDVPGVIIRYLNEINGVLIAISLFCGHKKNSFIYFGVL